MKIKVRYWFYFENDSRIDKVEGEMEGSNLHSVMGKIANHAKATVPGARWASICLGMDRLDTDPQTPSEGPLEPQDSIGADLEG